MRPFLPVRGEAAARSLHQGQRGAKPPDWSLSAAAKPRTIQGVGRGANVVRPDGVWRGGGGGKSEAPKNRDFRPSWSASPWPRCARCGLISGPFSSRWGDGGGRGACPLNAISRALLLFPISWGKGLETDSAHTTGAKSQHSKRLRENFRAPGPRKWGGFRAAGPLRPFCGGGFRVPRPRKSKLSRSRPPRGGGLSRSRPPTVAAFAFPAPGGRAASPPFCAAGPLFPGPLHLLGRRVGADNVVDHGR